MVELPKEFAERMKSSLGDEFGAFCESYKTAPQRAIRVNTLKIGVGRFKEISPFGLTPVEWEPSGFYVEGEGLGRTVLHAAGAYYVQEPSAMSVVPAMELKEGERTLDLCSAPGGKGSQIASYLKGSGVLVLNEPVPARRDILARNIERLGIKNVAITCALPENLENIFGGYFDKILVDAPCSGEGMFKKEENAIPEWSLENVKMCAERQKRILQSADKMLCGGGRIVYSTCTFSPEEDELQVEDFLASHGDYRLIAQKKLYPHQIRGEGHFYAVLQKGGNARAGELSVFSCRPPKAESIKPYREWEAQTLSTVFRNLRLNGNLLFAFGEEERDISSLFPERGIRNVRQGTLLGKIENGLFTPAHPLAARLSAGEARCIGLDEETALAYLRGLTFACNANLKGWYLATYLDLPLGWCKAVNGTAKNHYPKGLRI